MGLTTFVYGAAPAKAFAKEINFLSDDIRLALATVLYTPDQDNHAYWSSVVANEATGTGWAAGGVALASKAVAYDAPTNRQKFSAADLSVAGVSVSWRYGIVYDRTPATDATRPLLLLIDWGSTQTLTAGTFALTWSPSLGMFGVTAA